MARRWTFAALLLGGCSLDLGSTAATPCAPSPDFFVSDVWPRYLAANGCAIGGCHALSDGHGTLRLRDVTADPAPTAKQALDSWPLSWRENYLSTIHLVECNAPLESRLLTVPEGVGDLHPPGPVVLYRQTAQAVMESWPIAP